MQQCQKLWVMVDFTVAWLNLRVFQRGGRKQHKHVYSCFFSFLVTESPWNSIKESQTLTTHNITRHCLVRFYTFAGQPLSKQLYIVEQFFTYKVCVRQVVHSAWLSWAYPSVSVFSRGSKGAPPPPFLILVKRRINDWRKNSRLGKLNKTGPPP